MKKLLYGVLFALAPVVSLCGDHSVKTLPELQNAINKAAAHAKHTTTITIEGEIVGLVTVPATKQLIILEGKKGATLNGDQDGTTLTVAFGAEVELKSLTIANGSTTDRNSGGGILNLGKLRLESCVVTNNTTVAQYGYGGGIHNKNVMCIEKSSILGNASQYYGGGVYNSGRMEIEHSTIAYNEVNDTMYDNGYVFGGGVFNDGELTVDETTIEYNIATRGNQARFGTAHGAGVYTEGHMVISNSTIRYNVSLNYGAGIENDVRLSIENCKIYNNTNQNGDGAGIYNDYGTLHVKGSTIKDNVAENGNGAGVFNAWLMEIKDCSIHNNIANNGNGGGVFNDWQLTIEDSTIKSNQAPNGDGGGLYNTNFQSFLHVINAQIEKNIALYGGGIANEDGARLQLTNSKVFENTASSGIDGGGGIYNPDPSQLQLKKSKVFDNRFDNIFPPL